MLLASMLILLLLFSLIGMEIAWAIGFAAFAYMVLSQFTDSPRPFVLFAQQMITGIDGFILLAIPLFIFAGELMNVSGITQRMVAFASAFVGHLRGGLANVGVVANYIMSGVSGSALADAAATGTVLVPEMKKRGFPPAFSSAVIASAATVGPIIPPSISFVLLGAIVEVSVGRLFLGGVIPGTVMFIAMFAITWWLCRKHDYPVEPRATPRERVKASFDGFLALLAPVFVVGSIIFGIATPTEAAALAVLYTLILGLLVYRNTSLSAIVHAAGSAALATGVVMLTVATSQIFAFLAVQEKLGEILTRMLLSISNNIYVILAMVNVLMLILGMFMEILPIMLLLAPILFPLLKSMGVSEVHFGVVMVLNLMIGMITPPIGLNLFMLSTISGEGVITIFKRAIPYVIVLIAVLMLITYIPWLTLFIPDLVLPERG
ncbi:MAG: TRAP transporter large permease [Alphaproteobacteria bacterium]|nr:TRAP transporter large permease [Alphaproteobacteria bacterium]